MAKIERKVKDRGVDNVQHLINEYGKIKLPVNKEPINTSQFTLPQQLKRFAEFSHNENESMILNEEANAI